MPQYVTNNPSINVGVSIIGLMPLLWMLCSFIIILYFAGFVNMPILTIFLFKVCQKSGKCKKIKKFKKTIDKLMEGCYNTTEVEINFENKAEFPFSPCHRECVWLILFPLSRGVVCVRRFSVCIFLFLEVQNH